MGDKCAVKSELPLAGYAELLKRTKRNDKAISFDLENLQSRSPGRHSKVREELLRLRRVINPGDNIDEVIGHENVLSTILRAFGIKFALVGTEISAKSGVTAILLAGVPGVGKSTILNAAAGIVANTLHLSVSVWQVSASTLLSTLHGESEASVRLLYVIANEVGPSIICFDEVDGIMRGRSQTEDEHSRRFKTELLQSLQGSTPNTNVLTLGGTNRPWELDDGFLRRFQRQYVVGLPSPAERILILAKALKAEAGLEYCKLDFKDLDVIKSTDGFTGDDIFRAVSYAVHNAAYFEKNGKYIPDAELLKLCMGTIIKLTNYPDNESLALTEGNLVWKFP